MKFPLVKIQWWFVNPGSDSPEISLIRTKIAGTDFLFWTDGRFSNPENLFIRKYLPGTNVSGLTNHHCNYIYNTPLPLLKTKIISIFKQNVGIQILPVCMLESFCIPSKLWCIYICSDWIHKCFHWQGTIDVVKVYILSLLYTLAVCICCLISELYIARGDGVFAQ